jgi:hypothetical protein
MRSVTMATHAPREVMRRVATLVRPEYLSSSRDSVHLA